jgi:MFS family permease
MRSTKLNAPLLGLFWLGIQLVWGALLGISLQARSAELSGGNALASFGLIAAVGPVVAAIAQIASGAYSDARRKAGDDRARFYFIGAAVAAAGIVWFYLAPSYAQLFGAMMVIQLAMNFSIAAYQAAIPDFVPVPRQGNASAWMAALQSIGNATGALVASFVPSGLAVGLIIALALVVTAFATGLHVMRLPLREAVAEPLRISRTLVDLLISRALLFLGFYTLLFYLYYYVAQTLHVPEAQAKMHTGVLLLLFTVAGAIGAAIAARPADRFDRRFVAMAGAFVFAISLAVFVFVQSVMAIGFCAVAAGGAWGVMLTADWALGSALLPKNALATAMAIWNLALIVPQILAPSLTTAILHTFHLLQAQQSARTAFMIATIEVFAGGIWLLRLPAWRIQV